MRAVGYTATTIAVVIYAQLTMGFALATMWRWFVVPALSVAEISIPVAIGLCTLIKFLRYEYKDPKYKEEDWSSVLARGFVVSTVSPLFTLAVGWVVKQFA